MPKQSRSTAILQFVIKALRWDVAGHMQKYAAPNTIAISRTIVEPLTDVAGFSPTENVVDGYEVFAWSVKA